MESLAAIQSSGEKGMTSISVAIHDSRLSMQSTARVDKARPALSSCRSEAHSPRHFMMGVME